MTSARPTAPGRLLTRAAGEGRTGALVVTGQPGGTIYLLDGQVTYAESPAAPGVGELLTASGRLATRTWQAAVDVGTAVCRVGAILVEQGHLTLGELELCVLGATYDAAYFVLSDLDAAAEFRDGAGHWLGTVVQIDSAAVNREARRRGRLLEEICTAGWVDSAPVNPVQRPPTERVTVTALQWELLVHADGQRTPADLAHLLGRAGYATVQELRRLAAHRLLQPPGERTDEQPAFVRLPRARGPAVDATRPTLTGDESPPAATQRAAVPAPRGDLGSSDPPADRLDRPPRLARRKPGAKLPAGAAADPAPHQGTDEVLLKRLRTALRALR